GPERLGDRVRRPSGRTGPSGARRGHEADRPPGHRVGPLPVSRRLPRGGPGTDRIEGGGSGPGAGGGIFYPSFRRGGRPHGSPPGQRGERQEKDVGGPPDPPTPLELTSPFLGGLAFPD